MKYRRVGGGMKSAVAGCNRDQRRRGKIIYPGGQMVSGGFLFEEPAAGLLGSVMSKLL